MLHRLLRVVLVIIMCALLLSAHPIPFYAQSNPQTAAPDEEELLSRTAALNGYSAGELELADVSAVKLVNGVIITRLKAVDPKSGEVVGAAYLDDKIVDEKTVRARAAAEWRAMHGALTPDVVARMSDMSPNDTLDVAVWLVADVQPLPMPDHTPATTEEGTATRIVEGSHTERGSRGESKVVTIPIPYDQVPESVRAKAALPVITGTESIENEVTTDKSESDYAPIPEAQKVETRARLAQIEEFKKQNQAHLREQLAPLKERFLEYLRLHGLRLSYDSEYSPLVVLEGLTLGGLEKLSRHPDVDSVYVTSNQGGPSLENARETLNGVTVNTWGGYSGDGVKVAVVESSRPPATHPFMSVTAIRDTNYPEREHPTQVGGIIGSTFAPNLGFALDADLYFSNAGVNSPWPSTADFHTAIDWGASNASILNNSWKSGGCGTADVFNSLDRHLDYIVRNLLDLTVVASGNDRPDGCSNGGDVDFVSSPGKGYNSLTVGAFRDQNSSRWDDDAMRDSSQYNVSGRIKPEMVASGSWITTLLAVSPWITTTGGTSLAAPMVSATAANMIQADPNLSTKPEAITAVLMATALHNIVDNTYRSRPDGAGALDAAAALVTLEGGHWASQSISSSTTFPLEFSHFAYKGERVRYVIRWLSNPDYNLTTDPLPADLDLVAFRADGTTTIIGSYSSFDSFEIVDFIAPASETYVFKVNLYGSWNGGSTRLGRGWWNGVKRYSPNTGYHRPKAPPMGFHITVDPADWSPNYYWRAFGIRPVSSDHDLRLYSHPIFDDPYLTTLLAESKSWGENVDLIAVDGNHWNSSDPEHYVIRNDTGSGDYKVSWSNQGIYLTLPGIYGPYTIESGQVLKVFDTLFGYGETKRIMIIPDANSADLGVGLYQSIDGIDSTYTQAKTDQVAGADSSTSPNQTESFAYTYTNITPSYDQLGLVVYSKTNATARFYIYFGPDNSIYLPLINR